MEIQLTDAIKLMIRKRKVMHVSIMEKNLIVEVSPGFVEATIYFITG